MATRLFPFHLRTLLYSPTPVFLATPRNVANYHLTKASLKGKTLAESLVRLKPGEEPEAKKMTSVEYLSRRTRSKREFKREELEQFLANGEHIPVLLGEVLDVFRHRNLCSFVDCTVGAYGHSSAITRAHSEMQIYFGLDVDSKSIGVSHPRMVSLIKDRCTCGKEGFTILRDVDSPPLMTSVIKHRCGCMIKGFNGYLLAVNFKDIKSHVEQAKETFGIDGVDGILIDLGMSSMQVDDAERGFSVLNDGPLDMRMGTTATLKAEDILNTWPETEVGRILREYGEESNWKQLQAKIVKARLSGGLHSTKDLVNLIQNTSARSHGRQGWIKTATRVFQALRIAVNDELKTLEDGIRSSFDCLSPGGRLAVISFHSLEDRIVKQTFLNLIGDNDGDDNFNCDGCEEDWIQQRIQGNKGTILTKRPITPCAEEVVLNRRSRSAKLRVVQKK